MLVWISYVHWEYEEGRGNVLLIEFVFNYAWIGCMLNSEVTCCDPIKDALCWINPSSDYAC